MISKSIEETLKLGNQFAQTLKKGDVVALYGAVGAGKTHFCKGICTHFQIPIATVNSPTFTIVQEYEGLDFPVYHFDAYRINHVSEFDQIGYEDYFYGDGICLIEWAENVEALLPPYAKKVHFSHLSDKERSIET